MRRKITTITIGLFVSFTLLFIVAFLAENARVSEGVAVLLTALTTALIFVFVFYAAKLEHTISVYECRACGHTFKPTFYEYLWGAHMFTTRRLTCPECGVKTWCKRKTAVER